MTTWINITKATGTTWTKRATINAATPPKGQPIGLLMALTYATSRSTDWTKITKATGTSWTNIPKAT